MEVPLYQTEIVDIVRRRNLFGQAHPAGPGHRAIRRANFEQTAIPNPATAGFVDPRNIKRPVVTPTRIEPQRAAQGRGGAAQLTTVDMELGGSESSSLICRPRTWWTTIDGVMLAHDVSRCGMAATRR